MNTLIKAAVLLPFILIISFKNETPLNNMMSKRCYSAPPAEKNVFEDEIELEEIQNERWCQRKEGSFWMRSPKLVLDGQGPFWGVESNDFIAKAFSERRTGVEMIDMDYPESEICTQFKGISRTTTPVGDKPVILPDILQASGNTVMIPITTSSSQKPESSPVVGEIQAFYETISSDFTADIKTMCAVVCKDQEGSRFIQGRIEAWSPTEISFFFSQIQNFALELSMNLFGNYVIQKIIPYLSEEESFKLILQFFGQIVELSLHVYGCRVIQKFIDNLDDIKFIIAELDTHILELIASPNGNHVIQKCIDKDVEKRFLLKEFEANCIFLAQQRYGCRVLQRLFEVCDEEDTLTIYNSIVEDIGVLINDKYGNYVIQHLIQSNSKKHSNIFTYIIENSFELSKHKFSSNVIEKCVNNSTKDQLEAFLAKFLEMNDGKKPNLFYMCTDMYANYVVQRFFDIADADIKARAKTAIRPYLKEMKAIPFTKHILARLS